MEDKKELHSSPRSINQYVQKMRRSRAQLPTKCISQTAGQVKCGWPWPISMVKTSEKCIIVLREKLLTLEAAKGHITEWWIHNRSQWESIVNYFDLDLFPWSLETNFKTSFIHFLPVMEEKNDTEWLQSSHMMTWRPQSRSSSCFTTSEICDVFAFTLISIVQAYLQTLWCLTTSITTTYFCLVLETLTSPNFHMSRIDWPVWKQRHPIYSQCSTDVSTSLVTINISQVQYCLLTYKTREKQPFIFTQCLPYHSHPICWDHKKQSLCQSLGCECKGISLLCPIPSEQPPTYYLSVQPPHLRPSGNEMGDLEVTFKATKDEK